MRLIDADDFDRRLAAAEFNAALNNADDESRPFEKQTMYYSMQSFRDVMKCRPTIDAVPVVRCKDCVDYILNTDNIDTCCECSGGPDWYCAAGERMEDKNDSSRA